MGETRVDLQHLLEDLRDAYTGALEETILTEVVANALDSGAVHIGLFTNRSDSTLTILDDGRGMQRRELARYHDVAASSKARGEGIGFAGVGIKLGLLVSREVVTETRRGATHVATRWHLASRHRAPWKWITPPGLTDSRGTAVRLTLSNQLSPLLDPGYVEEAIRGHFAPLFDAAFDEFLGRKYPRGVSFRIDGQELARLHPGAAERAPISIRLGRRRTPSAAGFLERHTFLEAERQGLAISTFGKIIKRGWDWLGISPPTSHISGLIEVPDLAACLTLSKNDFIRTGTRGATYLAYRKAIQEVVSQQLAAWGNASGAEARPRVERLERDLERVLEDLADDFPLLQSLVDLANDIRSLSEFKRNTVDLLDRLRRTGHPLVLTINGKAELVVQDAGAYQALLDRVEAIEGIQRGLADVKAGRTRPARQVFARLRRKHGIPR